ncbi:MAG: pyridoxamine 5'-phosphate oxidase family protein [Gammaproteobacteria bacterium]|nr:pyridoxamine 5'-phosphate oxidase family protein [Gammaproteobacteria bacterium]
MGKIHEQISDELTDWIQRQHVFFVATAPLAPDGHVNCSPKGGDSFRVIDSHTVAYQDLTGSGAETIAHLRENGRIVIMFCAFEGAPKIVRLHGRGEVIIPAHPDFEPLSAFFPENLGMRAIIRTKVARISDSCGFAVPIFDYQGQRDLLDKWTEAKGDAKLKEYRQEKNARSIDGLSAIDNN